MARTKHCPHCDSQEVRVDAWAAWDDTEQVYVLHDYYDQCFCEDCEASFNIDFMVEKDDDDP